MEQLAGSRMALGKSRTKVAGFAPKSGAGLLSAQAGTDKTACYRPTGTAL